jgi:aryl-alcohol dehydrogenase-like predicted oxidoreductase
MARPSVTAAIASATSGQQVQQLVAATDIKLDRGALDRLDAASAYLAPA